VPLSYVASKIYTNGHGRSRLRRLIEEDVLRRQSRRRGFLPD